MKERRIQDGASSIPLDIKLYYIRNAIREIMDEYVKEYRIFRAEFNSVHKKNLEKHWINSYERFEYPTPIPKPNIYEALTTEKMAELIQEALKDRAE